jgi:RimJ/RimL family protein N-acetyltransferase
MTSPPGANPASDGAPIVNFAGELVALGPLRRELLPLYLKWINDFEVTRTLAIALRSETWEAELAWYEQAAGGQAGRAAGPATSARFTVYEKTTLRPIGNTELHNIDHQHRRAEFGIMLGEKDCWGKGYGTETTRLMLDYGFTALGLHNIMLAAYSFNERGLRAYRRAGFREIGRRRESQQLGGRLYDVVYMDCLATEFHSPVLHRLLPDEPAVREL